MVMRQMARLENDNEMDELLALAAWLWYAIRQAAMKMLENEETWLG